MKRGLLKRFTLAGALCALIVVASGLHARAADPIHDEFIDAIMRILQERSLGHCEKILLTEGAIYCNAPSWSITNKDLEFSHFSFTSSYVPGTRTDASDWFHVRLDGKVAISGGQNESSLVLRLVREADQALKEPQVRTKTLQDINALKGVFLAVLNRQLAEPCVERDIYHSGYDKSIACRYLGADDHVHSRWTIKSDDLRGSSFNLIPLIPCADHCEDHGVQAKRAFADGSITMLSGDDVRMAMSSANSALTEQQRRRIVLEKIASTKF